MAIFCHFHRVALKRKIPETVYVSGICFVLLLFLSGATKNRTRDTRIFSPLLYQLSYGTIAFLIATAKIKGFFTNKKFLEQKYAEIIRLFSNWIPSLRFQFHFLSIAGNQVAPFFGFSDVAHKMYARQGRHFLVKRQGNGKKQFIVFAAV